MKDTASSFALACIAMAFLAGCFSMDVATTSSLKKSALSPEDGRPMEHIVVANYGWFLFNWIPIACGNARPGASFPWRFFSNHVDSALLHDRMMSHAAAKNADVRDLVFTRDEKVIFDLPSTDIPLPIPYILCFREIQFSGVLTQRATPVPSDEVKKKKAVEEMNQLLDRLNPEEDRK
jgi:hypothetical protein